MKKLFALPFLFLSLISFGQTIDFLAPQVITPAQSLFVSTVASPNINGNIPDQSGNGLTAQFKGAACLTSAGAMVLNFSSLSGVTVTSWEGTSTLTKSGNTITTTAGTLYHIVLSNGKIIPCFENGGAVLYSSDGLWFVTISGETASTIWTTTTQNTYFYGYANNCSRFAYFDGFANAQSFSYQAGFTDIFTYDQNVEKTRIFIEEGELQDFDFKITASTNTAEATNKGIFQMNYTNAANQMSGWGLYMNAGGTTLNFIKATSLTVTQTLTSSSFTNIKDGLPRVFGIIKKGTSVSFYLDGALISTGTLTSATINFSTGSVNGVQTAIGSVTGINGWSKGYLYNAQYGINSSQNDACITGQVDLAIPTFIWRCNKVTTRGAFTVYDDEIKGYFLVPTSGATIVYAFTPFAAGTGFGPVANSTIWGFPKGHWWAKQAYTVDLTNGGVNSSLSGKETNLAYSDVRVNASGNFKYYNNYECTNVRTYTSNPTSSQINDILLEIGYLSNDGILFIARHGQSNCHASNNTSTNPSAPYLGVQGAKILVDIGRTGNPAWATLTSKVNCDALFGDSVVTANVSLAYTAQADWGASTIRFIQYSLGATSVYNQGDGKSWSPNVSSQMVDKSVTFIGQGITLAVNEGIPKNKMILGALQWIQGEEDMDHGVAPATYYYDDALTSIEKLIDGYRAAGINTSRCIIEIVVIQGYTSITTHPGYEDTKFELIKMGYSGLKAHPSLAKKVYGIYHKIISNDTRYTNGSPSNTVHLNKNGQVNLGIDEYNETLRNHFRLFKPYN